VAYIKFIVIYIVKEHINTAEIIGGDIDLLHIKAQSDVFFAEDLGKIEQK